MTEELITSKLINEYVYLTENYGTKHGDDYFINPNALPKLIVEHINSGLGAKFTYVSLKDTISSADIILTEKDINLFFEERLSQVKGRYNNPPLEDMLMSKIKESHSVSGEYLDYYKKSINVLKCKNMLVLNFIEELVKNTISFNLSNNDKNIINDLDLSIDENGYILLEDTNRILTALYENIVDLLGLINVANDVTTYYDSTIYKLAKKDKTVPTIDLQIKDLTNNGCRGYIRLTKKQYEQLRLKSLSDYQKKLKTEAN